MSRAVRRHAGQLMSGAERWELRLVAKDLQAQIGRCYDPERLGELERQLGCVRREQEYDRHVSPRRSKARA